MNGCLHNGLKDNICESIHLSHAFCPHNSMSFNHIPSTSFCSSADEMKNVCYSPQYAFHLFNVTQRNLLSDHSVFNVEIELLSTKFIHESYHYL